MAQIQLKRDKLYEEVWTTPVSRLALKYGLSDVGLRKICRKLNVPVPYAGYWAKLQHGNKATKTPLPELEKGKPDTHIFHTVPEESRRGVKEEPVISTSSKYTFRKNIFVPSQLRAPHPLVEKTHEALKNARPDRYKRVSPRDGKGLDINVCPQSVNRALRIMNTTIKEAEYVGIKVSEDGSSLLIDGERVQFGLGEKVHQEKHVSRKGDSELFPPAWDYYPAGQLVLKLKHTEPIPRKKWSDSEHQKLEDQIGSFLSSASLVPAYIKQERYKIEERRRRYEEKLKAEREQERLRLEEERRRKELEDQAVRWTKSQQILTYIAEVERMATTQGYSSEETTELDQWLTWARKHAERLNPLSEGLPFLKDGIK